MNTRFDGKGRIFDVQRFCLHDGPGIRTTVFFKGCPLDCAWCHNPESKGMQPQLSFHAKSCIGCGACAAVCPAGAHVLQGEIRLLRERCQNCFACVKACPSGALSVVGREATVEELLAEALRDRPFYGTGGGLTVSGGEPFMQPAFLLALLKAAKAEGLHTCVETAGATTEADLLSAAPYVDLFLFDCKLAPGEAHRRYVGCTGEALLQNLRRLDASGAKVVLRCPIIPGVNDTAAHFRYLAALVGSLCHIVKIDIEPYHTAGLSKAANLGIEAAYTCPDYDPATLKARLRAECLPILAETGIKVEMY